MNDNYSALSGGGIYAGRFFTPTWLTAASGTWGVIPTTNTLDDMNARYNPALNPVYPDKPEWEFGNYSGRVYAWNGFSMDEDGGIVWCGPAGGHGDYGGNDVDKLDIRTNSPAWQKVKNPTGALPSAVVCDDGQESSGLYADGQARSPHTYNANIYIPNVGPALGVLGSSVFRTIGGPNKPAIFSKDTGLLHHFGTLPPFSLGATVVTAAAYDTNRHAIYARTAGTGAVGKYTLSPDSTSGTWTSLGGTFQSLPSSYINLTYLPDHDCLVIIGDSSTQKITVIDCATGTTYKPAYGAEFPNLWASSSPKYLEGLNRLVTWNNSAGDTVNLYSLSFTSNPRTDTWTHSVIAPSGGNSVTPTARQTNGTYGRFFHDPKLKIFGLVNGISEQPYYFNYRGFF